MECVSGICYCVLAIESTELNSTASVSMLANFGIALILKKKISLPCISLHTLRVLSLVKQKFD